MAETAAQNGPFLKTRFSFANVTKSALRSAWPPRCRPVQCLLSSPTLRQRKPVTTQRPPKTARAHRASPGAAHRGRAHDERHTQRGESSLNAAIHDRSAASIVGQAEADTGKGKTAPQPAGTARQLTSTMATNDHASQNRPARRHAMRARPRRRPTRRPRPRLRSKRRSGPTVCSTGCAPT